MSKEKQARKQVPAQQRGLKPVRTHEEAVERGRKGGLVKSDRKRWGNRKKCYGGKRGCPYYTGCPAISLSLSQFKGRCAIKQATPEIRETFINLFEEGRHGLVQTALATYFRLIQEIGEEATPYQLEKTTRLALDMISKIHGDKTQVEHEGLQKIEIQVVPVGHPREEGKE